MTTRRSLMLGENLEKAGHTARKSNPLYAPQTVRSLDGSSRFVRDAIFLLLLAAFLNVLDDVADRLQFLKNAERWKEMSPAERETWRKLIRKLPDVPPPPPDFYEGTLPPLPPASTLPLPRGGFCSFSPDGQKLAYNRIFREFRTWKRYRGGMADDIWIYDFAAKTVENITANPALDIIPMWSGDRIYFLSDRDEKKRMNLCVYDLLSKATRKLTLYCRPASLSLPKSQSE
jgi:hypothetical protein